MNKILPAVAMLCLVGCAHDVNIVRVKDAQEPETLAIKYAGSGAVKKLVVHATGEIDGQATVFLMHESEGIETRTLRKGKVDFQWNVDWAFNTAEIGYAPTSVKVGDVAFEYRFDTAK